MATINMNAVQFYNPSSTAPSLSARCAATVQKYRQPTGIPHRKEWSRVLESYSQSQNASEDIASKHNDHADDGSIAADEDDEFPLVDEVIRCALHLKDSTEKPTNSALAVQGIDETFFLDGSGSSMLAQSNLPSHLGGSKEQPVILDDDDDDNNDDDDDDDENDNDSNSTSGGGVSSDLNTDGTGREFGPPPSTTPYPGSRPSSSRDPSLHPSAAPHNQSLEGQAIQQDDGGISREMSEQPSCLALILSRDEDDETEKGQQQQEAGEDREQGPGNSDTSSNGSVDGDDNQLQDNNENEVLQPTKCWLSPSCDPAIRRSRKRRLQRPHHGCSTNPSKLARADLVLVRKETQHPSPSVSDDSDDSDRSEAPRPAKRRRPSPSNSDPTPNRSQRRPLRRPSESRSSSPSKLDRSQTAPPQTQLKLPLNSDDCAQSQHSSTHSSTDDEQISTLAEYREWPMNGFFKRTTIGNETRYSMDFSLEQLQGLCALACPQHATLPNSDRDSVGPANLPKVSTRVKKTRSAPPSRSKRTPFTSKENAMLVDLKENKGWPWKRIEPKFPQRTLNSLQVHYCTKLKGKVLTEGDESV